MYENTVIAKTLLLVDWRIGVLAYCRIGVLALVCFQMMLPGQNNSTSAAIQQGWVFRKLSIPEEQEAIWSKKKESK